MHRSLYHNIKELSLSRLFINGLVIAPLDPYNQLQIVCDCNVAAFVLVSKMEHLAGRR